MMMADAQGDLERMLQQVPAPAPQPMPQQPIQPMPTQAPQINPGTVLRERQDMLPMLLQQLRGPQPQVPPPPLPGGVRG